MRKFRCSMVKKVIDRFWKFPQKMAIIWQDGKARSSSQAFGHKAVVCKISRNAIKAVDLHCRRSISRWHFGHTQSKTYQTTLRTWLYLILHKERVRQNRVLRSYGRRCSDWLSHHNSQGGLACFQARFSSWTKTVIVS